MRFDSELARLHAPTHFAVHALALAAVVAATGCKDEVAKTEPTPAASSSVVATASAAPPAAPAPTASAPQPLGTRLHCDKLLPDSALLSFAAGYKVMQLPATQSKCPECGPSCSLLQAGKPYEGAHVAYTCNEPYSKEAADKVLEPLKKELKKPTPIKGFGRGGLVGEKDNGTWFNAVVFDDDTDCLITIEWMHGKQADTLALAKVAVAGIKPADLK